MNSEPQHAINSILSFDNSSIWIARIHFAASKNGEIGGSRMDTNQPARWGAAYVEFIASINDRES